MLATKKIFHSQLPKTTLNNICFTFLSYWKTSDLHFILEDFSKKQLYQRTIENHLKINFKFEAPQRSVKIKI